MTQITFLHGAQDRLQSVAAWISASVARRAFSKLLVYVPDGQAIENIDRLLWVQPATGFTPHCRATDKLASQTPIVLATELDSPPHDESLLNLSDSIPSGFSRFQQVIEIVSVSEENILRGRERYRYYRERGYPLEAREISESLK